ncbi:zinc finger protein-like 1 homolog [Asparagus officinalis]|uniref:zinc finger protein-like 1 homolog n=1 Tax=Asparagus officinalis TaxID=4686 RepID=UPI00098E0033|nr:zinc finger protein-like 1 homolog [Asparagus officinalis]XP_020257713.1 zinc finger protein-like 1 homolog [Asparagus officinalis]
MVVCKCRKATRIYCFVHKVPVCGECICFPEHQICVVKNYSDWVVNGDYDWPPTCSVCNIVLVAGTDTTRLGCLHVMHTTCLVSHAQSFPPQTAPAGYVCPSCSSPIWPPKSIKDTGSRLHSKLKEAIIMSGLEKNIFGNHLVSLPTLESRAPPPAFDSDPITNISSVEDRKSPGSSSVINATLPSPSVSVGTFKHSEPEIVEIDGPSSLGSQFVADKDPKFVKSGSLPGPGAATRKGPHLVERQNSEISYYADDEDGTHKKYTRRGSLRHKFLRFLLPFWSSALPTLPVTAPPRKDRINLDDATEGRVRQQRSSRTDPRKILLTMAIMACLATMGILYYRLAQSLAGDVLEDEPQ